MPHLLDGRSLAILRIIPDVRDTFADRVWESGPAALQRIPLETRQEGVSQSPSDEVFESELYSREGSSVALFHQALKEFFFQLRKLRVASVSTHEWVLEYSEFGRLSEMSRFQDLEWGYFYQANRCKFDPLVSARSFSVL